MKYFCTMVLTVALSGQAWAEEVVETAPGKIAAIANAIPFTDKSMPYRTLGDRLPRLGLKVERIRFGKVSQDEATRSAGIWRRGDVLFMLELNQPNAVVHKICPISSQANFIKRGKVWLADNRTANFLMNDTCAAP